MIQNKKISVLICLITLFISEFCISKTLVFSSPQGGDFKIGKNSENFVDTKKLRGNNLILLFGYTQCKSVCPFSLRNIKNALLKIPDQNKKNIKVIFISVDNERDQHQKIAEFLDPFGPEFLGSTGQDKDLKKILSQFGARYYRYKTENNKLLVDHSSDFFIINKKGIWTHTLPFDATIETISSAILKSDTLSEHENQYPESRKVKLIPTTQCPLNSKTCQFQIQNETFQVELANRTVRPQYENRFILKSISQKPSELTPIEIDIEGVDLYMGLNRPQFSKNQNQYEVNFNLPMCEIKKMKWKSTLIFKSKFNQYFAVQYFFKSEDQ